MLAAKRKGAKLIVVDPRYTPSASFSDLWLGLEVGSDIALANAVGREIIERGLHDEDFIANATLDFDAYAEQVQEYTLERAEAITGVPVEAITELAVSYATAPTAELCWTLGITEHHNAVNNVFSLCNLALLCGHVGRYGSGLCPLRGQNNVQGGGDMGALPNRLPGFQSVEDTEARNRFEQVWGSEVPAKPGWHLSQMFEAMEAKELRCLYVIGENPANSEANVAHARKLLGGLDFMVVQDIRLTDTAALADVVLPATASFAESTGTATNSERRVQVMRPSQSPPGEARDDLKIVTDLARACDATWPEPDAEEVWNELRQLSPMHSGMSYQRLEESGGIRWPCRDENDPGSLFLHARLWERPVSGPLAPFKPVAWESPIDELDEEFPIRLTTGRRLDSYNTGVQSGFYDSPIRSKEALDLNPQDAARLELSEGEVVKVSSRRGNLTAPVHITDCVSEGLAFLTLHFPDQVDTNLLISDKWDPQSGTGPFKATAIRVDKLAG